MFNDERTNITSYIAFKIQKETGLLRTELDLLEPNLQILYWLDLANNVLDTCSEATLEII